MIEYDDNAIQGGNSSGDWLVLTGQVDNTTHYAEILPGDIVHKMVIVSGDSDKQTITTDTGLTLPSRLLGLVWVSTRDVK